MQKPVSPFGQVIASARCALAGLLLFSAGGAWAGFITLMETELETIFSQTGFGASAIDVRFNAGLTVANSGLLLIDTDEDFTALSGLSVFSDRPTINLFFVDTITFCNEPGNSIIGCGTEFGNVIAVKSTSAANTSTGDNLMAHELGHNFGLPHREPNDNTNLMNSSISGSSALTADQITTILNSSLVQLDGTQRFVSITPIAIVASIPEPRAWAMMGLGLLALTGWARRKRS